jgi:hypothetical protein
MVGLIAMFLVCLTATASATTTADAPYGGWLAAAHMPPLPQLAVEPTAACEEPVLGCSDATTFVAADDRFDFLHEMGHVYIGQYILGRPDAMARIASLVGHPKLDWDSFGEDNSLQEATADAFAQCGRLRWIRPEWGLSVGSVVISGKRLQRLCAYMRSL